MTPAGLNRELVLTSLVDIEGLRSRGVELDRRAITDGDLELGWEAFATRVARLASVLVDAGVRPGDRVGVELSNSVDAFVAVHAILRTGGVVVPLDRSAPTDYVSALVHDAGISVLIGDPARTRLAGLADRTELSTLVLSPGGGGPPRGDAVGLDVITGDDVEAAQPVAAVAVEPGDPAYIIYTSGSTGRPKGIVHSHRSAMAYAHLSADTYGIGPEDRIASIAPLHFDQSTFGLYSAALAGSSIVVVPDALPKFPASLSRFLDDHRVTVVYTVPYLLAQLLARGVLEDRDLAGLRWVLYGGEPFAPHLLRGLMRRLPHARFSNVYGPAEVNQCTYFHLDAPPRSDEPVPIGKAWADTELMVVDTGGRPVAVGEHGELLVRSTTMMDRYWNRADLTDACIRLRECDGVTQRWYATGDLVVERPDGDLVFVGRVDNQVKVRGHRVELEAIDAVLNDHSSIREGVAAIDRSLEDGAQIVAIVVADLEEEVEQVEAAVLAELRRSLPPAAVPTEVAFVTSLPRTGSGKVDRASALRMKDDPADPRTTP